MNTTQALSDQEVEIAKEAWSAGYEACKQELEKIIANQSMQIAHDTVTLESYADKVTALQAHIEELRKALEDMLAGWKYIRETHGDLYGVGWFRAQTKAETALASTPQQSLQAHDDEVIERCAKICDDCGTAQGAARFIRLLKEK